MCCEAVTGDKQANYLSKSKAEPYFRSEDFLILRSTTPRLQSLDKDT